MTEENATTQKQDKALAALLSEPTIKAAAKKAGVDERTLLRWLGEDQGFIEAYRAVRREALRQAMARLQESSSEAVETLREIMTDEEKPGHVRVAAASKVLDLAIRAGELDDLQAEVDRLRGMIDANNGG